MINLNGCQSQEDRTGHVHGPQSTADAMLHKEAYGLLQADAASRTATAEWTIPMHVRALHGWWPKAWLDSGVIVRRHCDVVIVCKGLILPEFIMVWACWCMHGKSWYGLVGACME